MKKIILIIAAFAFAFSLRAQQLPLYSQYYFNSMVFNPSHTGIDAGAKISLTARKQFTGIASPIGTYAGIFQTRNLGQNSGFGLYVYSDDLNLFRTNSATGSYAYHIPLSDENVLSFGLGLSVIDSRYNQSNFFLIDEADPIIANLNNGGGVTFDGNAGANIKIGKFGFGLSSFQILGNQEEFSGSDKSLYTLANHWMLNASYKIPIGSEMELEPLLLYRKAPAAPGQTDINLFLNWMNKGYAGIAYRDGMSVSGMLGVDITNNMTAGYAFDFTVHKLRAALGNTHELMVQFDLSKGVSSDNELLAEEERKLYINKIEILEEQVAQKNEGVSRIDTFIIERMVEVENESSMSIEERNKYKSIIAQLENELKVAKESKPAARIDTVVVVRTVEKIVKETVPTTTTPIQTGNYYVIAGTFVNNDEAVKYMLQLKARGYESNKKLHENGRYYVYISNHTNKDSAVEYISKMKGSGLPLWIKSM